MLSASELHQRGLAASNAGRHAKARATLLRALERSPDPSTRARILLSLAHVESELGDRDSGLALCEEALAIADIGPTLTGLIYSQRALLLMRAGAPDASLEAFAQALRLLPDDPEPRTRAHLNRGNVYLQRGQAAHARAEFERAVDYARRGGLTIDQAKAEHNLGYAHLLTGDLASALQMMDRARPTLSTLSLVYEAVCEQDRAEALAAAGMVSEAEAALRASAAAFGARGLRQQQAEAELTLSRLLRVDDPRTSARVAQRAHRRFERRRSDGWSVRARGVAVGARLASGDHAPQTIREADDLVDGLLSLGVAQEASTLLLQLAGAAIARRELESASARVKSARVGLSSPLSNRLLDREVRASLAAARGRRTDAVSHLRRGLADLHSWQSSFGSLDLQSSLVGHGRGLALTGLKMAVDDGRPEVVFEWAERARALASRVSPVRPPVDAQAAADLADLRQLQSEIAAAESAGHIPKALLAHANRLRSKIRQRAWYGEGSGVVTEPASLEEAIGELASAGGLMLSYLVVEGSLYALVLGSEHPELVELGHFARVRSLLDGLQADLDMAAARLPQALATGVRSALAHRLQLLSDALVAPLRERLGDRRVVVVPAGSLAGVPWSLLPGLVGTPLTVPRSATSWLRSRDSSPPVAQSPAGFVAGPRVARAEEEVARAAAPWSGATALTGAGADAAAVRSLAASVDVFHVAAHGRHSADNPLFSGLELADGPWFGYDIDQLEHIPSTVVLSACEAGRSSVRWGEETIGMTVAWLHAGSRCVVASPALVNDDVACEVLSSTHTALAGGAGPSDALAEAVASMARASAPAPFLCFGSGW